MEAKDLLSSHPLLADRVRLVIMAALSAAEKPLDFMTLLENLELTKGNLATHLRKLEEAGLTKVTKQFIGRKPQTTYECTKKGRSELQDYLKRIEAMLKGSK